jgi:hypothetical protein
LVYQGDSRDDTPLESVRDYCWLTHDAVTFGAGYIPFPDDLFEYLTQAGYPMNPLMARCTERGIGLIFSGGRVEFLKWSEVIDEGPGNV